MNKLKKLLSAITSASIVFSMSAFSTQAESTNKILVSNAQELHSALSNAKAGDEIILKEGVYSQEEWIGVWAVFYSEASGTAENPIILRSENPEKPATICGVSQENKVALRIKGSYWNISDLKVCEASKGIFLEQSEHSVISGCEVYNTGTEAIHIIDNSSYNLVENCFVHDAGTVTPQYGEGVYIGSSHKTEGYGFDCHYNTVRGCQFGPNIAADHVDIKEFTIGNVVENCTFDGTGIKGENGGNSFVEIKGNNCTVRNNTCYRNENEIIPYAFDSNVQLEGWGQNNKIYDNTLYMDTEECTIFKEWDCHSMVFRNKTYPENLGYSCSQTLQVLEFRLKGDSTEDGEINTEDITRLSNHLLNKNSYHISSDNSNLNSDNKLNVFDLCILKRKLMNGQTTEKPVISVDYVKEDAGKWRIYDGLGGRQVSFNLKAQPDSILNMGWGYWDAYYANDDGSTGKWISIALGNNTVDSNGNLTLTVDVPAEVRRVALEVWDYSYNNEELDADNVKLDSVITQ